MISIPAGSHQLWQSFTLNIPTPIKISPEKYYYLKGDNGSGKSSFISKLLLPQLKTHAAGCYRLYLEQQLQLQFHALRAHAAMHHHHTLPTDKDCIGYLLNDLLQSYQTHPRPVYFVIDECLHFDYICEYLQINAIPVCLIFTNHDENPFPRTSNTLVFQVESPNISVVYEAHN